MSYGEVLPIWWSVVWRGMLAWVAVACAVAFIAGYISVSLSNPDAAAFWGAIAGMLVSIPVSVWALRAAINKHHLHPVGTQT